MKGTLLCLKWIADDLFYLLGMTWIVMILYFYFNWRSVSSFLSVFYLVLCRTYRDKDCCADQKSCTKVLFKGQLVPYHLTLIYHINFLFYCLDVDCDASWGAINPLGCVLRSAGILVTICVIIFRMFIRR